MDNKLKYFIINHLNKKYPELVSFETNKWFDEIFFTYSGEVIFSYNKRSGKSFVSREKIWSWLGPLFGLRYLEIQELTKEWVMDMVKSTVTSTESMGIYRDTWIEEIVHSQTRTTFLFNENRNLSVKEELQSKLI